MNAPRVLIIVVIVFSSMSSIASNASPPQEPTHGKQLLGAGDGVIHVIPMLSSSSVKNGGKITVSALVKAAAGVSEVTADMGGVETISLQPSAQLGGVSGDNTVGMWSAEWNAHSLEEKIYSVAVRAVDRTGHVFEDHSLKFSDPAAGNSTPGSPNIPPVRLNSLTLNGISENSLKTGVLDAVNGYAYFATNTTPGVVVKVALGAGASAPSRINAVALSFGEDRPTCAVIDPANGYAYFGTSTVPGIVVKVALGAGATAPTRMGALTLNPGEDSLYSAVVDTAAGYAYFGTDTSPGIIVKVALGSGAALPTRIGALTLNSGENQLQSAVIDAANGYAYFGIYTYSPNPGLVVKVSLGTGAALPTRIGAVTLNAGEFGLDCAVIDPANGYAYFGTSSSPGIVVKVALGPGAALPSRVGAATFNGTENSLTSAVIDTVNNYGYFGTNTIPGIVVKVDLGAGASAPSRIGAATFNSGEDSLACAGIDITNGYAYFGTNTTLGTPGNVVKVSLGLGAAAPSRVNAVTLNVGEDNLGPALVDTANGYEYCRTGTNPASLVKVALGSGSNPPVRIGALQFNAGEIFAGSAVIDTVNGYAYFGTFSTTSPGTIIKVALGAGATPPVRIGSLALNPGENQLRTAVIDSANGYAYFGTGTYPGIVIKVALGTGSALPTRIGAVTLNSGEDWLFTSVIDPSNSYAYFGTFTPTPSVVKIALGSGAAPPTRVGSVVLPEQYLYGSVIDTAAGYAYFSTRTTPGIVVKVALGSGAAAPTRVGAVTLNTGENYVHGGFIDPANGSAYFGTTTGPGIVVKIGLGSGAVAPSRLAGRTLNPGDNGPSGAAFDPATGFAYLNTTTNGPGAIVKLATLNTGCIKATKMTMIEDGDITDVRFYSHSATGNVRLAIYDNASPKNLLWQSGSIANTMTNGFVVASISSGTPSNLTLTAGTYWLAFQVDTNAGVPSYTAGSSGDGFYFSQAFGAHPSTVTGEISTPDDYTEYVTYNTATIKFVISGAAAQAAGTSQNITITAKDNSNNTVSTYNGIKSLVFSGAASSSPVTAPTAGGTNFGAATSVTFTNGVASVSLVLYKTESANIAATQGSIITPTPLIVAVSPGPLSRFALLLSGTQTNSMAFTGTNTLTAVDTFGNTVSSFDASVQNVTLTANAALTGTISGLSSNGNNILGRTIDFTSGVADLTALGMKYTGNAATGTFTATAGGKSGTSGSVTLNPGPLDHFAMVLSSPQTYGTAFTGTNTLAALDVSGNTVTGFDVSANNITISPNTPLTGTITGLGSGGNNVLNRASDFNSGVADLKALGMYYTGGAATGTFKAVSANGKTGTSGIVGVAPAPLTVTTNAATKVYGSNNPAFTAGYASFVNGDTTASLAGTLAFTTSATAASPAGTYTVTPGGVTSSNYAITFTSGNLKVTPAPLTVSANAATKIQGAPNPNFTVGYSKFVNGDTAASLGGTLTFATPATAGSPLGVYPITPGGLTSNNYAISFSAGTLTVIIPAPTITSPLAANTTAGNPFSYTIAAANSPSSFNATGLPPGITFDPTTATLVGTPTVPGIFAVNLSASNSTGTGTAVLTIVVATPAVPPDAGSGIPVINSPASASASTGIAFTYVIAASNFPTLFRAAGLPKGLALNSGSGAISGKPTVSGTFTINLSAANSSGTGTAQLTLTISDPPPGSPSIAPAGTPVILAGSPLNISVSGGATLGTTFSATGLPPGVMIDPATGIISGTPTSAGVFNVSVTATSAAGSVTTAIAITVASQLAVAPAIVNGPTVLSASAISGAPVILSCAANQLGVAWKWDFGDGSTAASGNLVSHVYAAPGTYIITATATSLSGLSASTTLVLKVVAATGSLSDLDASGNGFPDEILAALGMDVTNPSVTPFDGAAAGAVVPLKLTSLNIGLNFKKGSSDKMVVTGILPLPQGFDPKVQQLVLDAGGVVVVFTLDAKGKSKQGNSTLALKFAKARKVKGAPLPFPAQNAAFAATIRPQTGNLSAFLTDEGLDNTPQKNQKHIVPVIVLFTQRLFRADAAVLYTATATSGSARIVSAKK